MTTAITTTPAQTLTQNTEALRNMAELLSFLGENGCMPGSKKPAEAVLCGSLGMRYGWNPVEACQRFHVVKGNVVMKADVMVGVAKAHPACQYFICKHTDAERATWETRREGSPAPESITFTMEDAKRAGVLNNPTWKKYPAQMLRARASAALVRMVYPDALAGIYTKDELTGDDYADADVIDVQVIDSTPYRAPQPERPRQSSPPQRQEPAVAAGVRPSNVELQNRRVAGDVYQQLRDYVARRNIGAAFDAYLRAKSSDPSKAQTLESMQAWQNTVRWHEVGQKTDEALPNGDLGDPDGLSSMVEAKAHLSKALGRTADNTEIHALRNRVRETSPGISDRDSAIASCLLAARCVRKPETLHLRLGLPKAGKS